MSKELIQLLREGYGYRNLAISQDPDGTDANAKEVVFYETRDLKNPDIMEFMMSFYNYSHWDTPVFNRDEARMCAVAAWIEIEKLFPDADAKDLYAVWLTTKEGLLKYWHPDSYEGIEDRGWEPAKVSITEDMLPVADLGGEGILFVGKTPAKDLIDWSERETVFGQFSVLKAQKDYPELTFAYWDRDFKAHYGVYYPSRNAPIEETPEEAEEIYFADGDLDSVLAATQEYEDEDPPKNSRNDFAYELTRDGWWLAVWRKF